MTRGRLEIDTTTFTRRRLLLLDAGQVAATGALAALGGRPVMGRAFAPVLQIDALSAALDGYES
jgi:hypothetical protein